MSYAQSMAGNRQTTDKSQCAHSQKSTCDLASRLCNGAASQWPICSGMYVSTIPFTTSDGLASVALVEETQTYTHTQT